MPLAVTHNPALIILDLHLLDGSGFDVAERLCADERTKNIPLFAVSAAAGFDSRAQAIAAGCVRYVSKPVTPRDLIALVDAQLAPSSLPAPL